MKWNKVGVDFVVVSFLFLVIHHSQGCPAGTYFDFGANCQDCPIGTYQSKNAYIGTTCSDCPYGTWNDLTGGDNELYCRECPEGSYTLITGATSVLDCVCIDFSNRNKRFDQDNPVLSFRACECEAGRYYVRNFTAQTSNTPTSSCLKCADDFYKPSAGNYDCVHCPTSAHSNNTHIECMCPTGYYNNYRSNGEFQGCTECPNHAVCEGGNFWAEDNYWEHKGSFFRCDISGACVDGSCARGYEGRLCAECAEGYTKEIGSQCRECDKPNYYLLFFLMIPLLFLFIIYVYNSTSSARTVGLVLFINFLQIFSQVDIPSEMASPLVYLELDLFQIFSAGCAVPSSEITAWVVRLLTPLILGVLVLLGYLCVQGYKLAVLRYRHKDLSFKDKEGDSLAVRCIRCVVQLSLMAHFVSTKAAVAMFTCRDLTFFNVLSAYPDIECWKGTHVPLFILALFVLIVFSIGGPIFVAVALIWREKLPPKLRKRTKFTFLTLNYSPAVPFWELVYVIRRMAVVLFCAFAINSPKTRAFLLVAVCFLSRLLHKKKEPFKYSRANTIESGYLLVLTFTFLLELLSACLNSQMASDVIAIIVVVLGFGTVVVMGALLVKDGECISGFFGQLLHKAFGKEKKETHV